MSTMFSHTTRALVTDNARGATLALLIITVLLTSWALWLSFARVTLYEQSVSARLERPSHLVATFPPSAFGHIQPDQMAQVEFVAFPVAQYGTLSAQVVQVTPPVADSPLEVTLILQPNPTTSIPLQSGLQGTVTVAIEQLSPAALLWRSVGL